MKTTDPELWQEIADAYADLRRTRQKGAAPPHSRPLIDLATRLREVHF